MPVTNLTPDPQLLRVSLDRKAEFSQAGPRFPDAAEDHRLAAAVMQVTDEFQELLVALKRTPDISHARQGIPEISKSIPFPVPIAHEAHYFQMSFVAFDRPSRIPKLRVAASQGVQDRRF